MSTLWFIRFGSEALQETDNCVGDKENMTHEKLQITYSIYGYHIFEWAYLVNLQATYVMN